MAADPDIVAGLLLARANLMASAPISLPVAHPDVAFAAPADGKYLRVDLFTNAPFWEGLSRGRMDQGILQITIVWPKGQGLIKHRAVAKQVFAHWPKGLLLAANGATVRVRREPWAAQPIMEPAQTLTPITISWSAT